MSEWLRFYSGGDKKDMQLDPADFGVFPTARARAPARVFVFVWTSVTKRTQGLCNNLAHQLTERAKISSMFYCILAGGQRAHHTARANEALYDVARKTYLQISSWAPGAQLE